MKVAVIGVGGVGSWAAYCTAAYAAQLDKPCSMLLIDGDIIEEKNVARMACGVGQIGRHKVTAVRICLREIAPTVDCTTITSMFHEDMIAHLADVNVVICATDTVATQRFLHTWCKRQSIRYIRAGYDGDTVNVTTQFPLTLEDEKVEAADAGYHGIPTIFPAIIAGALAARRVWFPDSPNVLGSLASLVIGDSTLVPESISEVIGTKYVEANDYHQDDDCPSCGMAHCENGDCNHDDCHDSCVSNDDYDYFWEALAGIHDRQRCDDDCQWCARDEAEASSQTLTDQIAELKTKIEELTAQLEEIQCKTQE